MISAKDVKELRDITGAGMLDCKKALEATENNLDAAIDYLREKGISKAQKKEGRIAAEGLTNIVINDEKAVLLELNCETDFVSQNENFKTMLSEISELLLNNDVTTVEEAMELTINGMSLNDYIIEKIAKIGEKITLRRFEVIKKENNIFGGYIHMNGVISTLIVLEGGNETVAKDIAMQAAAMKPKYVSREEASEEEINHEKEILREKAINEGKPENILDKIVEGGINAYFNEICLPEQKFVKDSKMTVKQYADNNKAVIKSMFRYEVGEGIEKKEDNFAEEVMKQING